MTAKKTAAKVSDMKPLLEQVRDIVRTAKYFATRSVNALQTYGNWQIGKHIVEFEQQGKERAGYGKKVLAALSKKLTEEFGRGYSEDNLESMRRFYLLYSDRLPPISEKASRKSDANEIAVLDPTKGNMFPLSWSHYVFLCRIEKTEERRFYEIEAADNGWSLPELKRQFNTSLYERLALSRDKKKIKELASKGQLLEHPQDMLKSPFVLEFLGLDEKTAYSENDLETAIINKIEHFLLELGKGFLFEARQKRFTFDADHFFVDLVFYNRLLRCYVLIDLKIGKLAHQDLGQMQMYVNYYDRYVKTADENPTVGIILCKQKSNALVEITLPTDTKIYASQYQTYLPTKDVLKRKLVEWSKEAEDEV